MRNTIVDYIKCIWQATFIFEMNDIPIRYLRIIIKIIFVEGYIKMHSEIYSKTYNISRNLVGNKTVDNSDVVGTSPVGAAPTTSAFCA